MGRPRKHKDVARPKTEAELAAEHQRIAWAVTHRYKQFLPSPKDEEGLFSECWMGVLRAIRKYDPARGSAFSTYVWPAAERAAQGFVRLEMRRGFTQVGDSAVKRGGVRPAAVAVFNAHQLDPESDDPDATFDPFLASVPDGRGPGPVVWPEAEWARVLRCLTPGQRRAVLLRFRDGLSLAEASERMGVSRERVRALAARGVEVLREEHPELVVDYAG